MNHPLLGSEPYIALQATREVRRMTAAQLGLSSILIDLTPAVTDKVTLSLDFVLDTENRLGQLAS